MKLPRLARGQASLFPVDLGPGSGGVAAFTLAFGVAGVLLLLTACASLADGVPVHRPAVVRVWDVPASTLEVPVHIPWYQVADWTEAAVPPTFRGEGTGSKTLSAWFLTHDWHYGWTYHLNRGPMALGWAKGKVQVVAPVVGTLQAWWDTLPGGATAHVEASTGVEASLAMTADWGLRSDSRLLLDVTRAELPIGISWNGTFFGTTIDIAQPLGDALRPALGDLARALDARIDATDLRPMVEGIWRDLQVPRAVGEVDGLWFVLDPESVSVGAPSGTPQDLEVDLRLTAHPSLTLGIEPAPQITPLPRAEPLVPGDPAWVVTLPLAIDWSVLARQALTPQAMTSQTADHPILGRLRSVEAYTDAERVLIRLEGRFSAPGSDSTVDAVVWFGALPVWDPSTRSLRLTNATLDIRTRDLLAQTASWMLQSSWVKDLEKTLVWDLGPELDRWKDQATRALASLPLGPHVTLEAALDRLEVVDFTLTDRGPVVLTRMEGRGSVRWVR